MWADPEFRKKRELTNKGHSVETRRKLSESMKEKFANDKGYKQKISEARKKYWDNPGYRSSRTWNNEKFIEVARLELVSKSAETACR